LRRREREEDENESNPAQRQEARLAGAVDGLVGELYGGGEVHAPGKQPCQVEQPEPQARNRVVVAGITQVQETQQLLIDEEEP